GYLRRLRPAQAFTLLINETWYPVWSASMAVLFGVPLVALVVGHQPAEVSLLAYVAAWLPLGLAGYFVRWWARPWQEPIDLGFSWRGAVLHVARWPTTLWALIAVLLRMRYPYAITAKADGAGAPELSVRSLIFQLCGALLSAAVIWQYLLRDPDDDVQGQVFWAVVGLLILLAVVVAHTLADLAELRRRGLGLGGVAKLRARA